MEKVYRINKLNPLGSGEPGNEEIGAVYNEVLDNKPDGMRKPRRITMISSL